MKTRIPETNIFAKRKNASPTYLPHSELFDFVCSLGYDLTDSGLCYGFAGTAMIAIFLDQTDHYNYRLQIIKSLYTHAQKFCGEDAPITAAIPELIRQIQNGHFKKANPCEREMVAEIRPFCDIMQLTLQPEMFPGWFENGKAPHEQHLPSTLPLILPDALLDKRDSPGSPFKEVRSLIVAGDLVMGAYTFNEAFQYFKTLRSVLHRTRALVSLLLCSTTHAMVVSYQPQKQQWLQADICIGQIAKYSYTDEITNAVFDLFSSEQSAIFSTQLYALKQSTLETVTLQWKQKKHWQRIHALDYPKTLLTDGCNRNLLHLAAQAGDLQTVKALLALNTTTDFINKYCGYGSTPLNQALESRQVECTITLLKKGARASDGYSYTSTPIMQVIRLNNLSLARIYIQNHLISYGSKKTCMGINRICNNADPRLTGHFTVPLLEAIKTGNPEMVALVMEAGAAINSLDILGQNPLELALALPDSIARAKIVSILKQHGCMSHQQSCAHLGLFARTKRAMNEEAPDNSHKKHRR